MDQTPDLPKLDTYWADLRRVALLGSARARPDAPLEECLRALHIEAELPQAEQLLEAAALMASVQRTSFERIPPESPGVNVPPPESRSVCTPRFAYFLGLLLGGSYPSALPEAIQLLHKHQRIAPPELLPELLQRALDEPNERPEILSIIGSRGEWLARLHPRWSQLLPPEAPSEVWAADANRLDALMAWRSVDPPAARLALEDRWSDLSPKQRADNLTSLLVQLQPDDEPLLERALDDRRKEVRQAAATLLLHLPGSQLLEQLWSAAASAMSWKGGRVQIDLPEELPEATKRLGIRPRANKGAGGLRHSWLNQLVERIPPDRWEEHFDALPHQIIEAWSETTYGDQLLLALCEALLRYKTPDWIEALIEHWLTTGREELWNQARGKQLLQQCPADIFQRLVTNSLERQGAFVPDPSLLLYWLSRSPHPWTNRMTRILIGGFRDLVGSYQRNVWMLNHYHQLLKIAAYRCPPDMARELRTGWPTQSAGFYRFSTVVEEMLNVVAFREELHRNV